MNIIEAFDPFIESLVLNFGENSSVVRRWNKLFNDIGFLVKTYNCVEDYPMEIYRLCFYLNNGREIAQEVEMNYGNYSYAEDLIVDIVNKIEDKICREGQPHYGYWTLLDEAKLGWKPIANWKREWEAKWDRSAKDALNDKFGMINATASWDTEQKWVKGPEAKNKEGKVMTNYEYDYIASRMVMMPKIKDVIFNNPATIVKWADGTKTVVKVQKGEPYDEEKGLAMAFIKKIYDNKGNYNDIFRKWCPKKEIPKVNDFMLHTFIDYLFADDYV